ncbi:HAMP domain-containing sensor histidine kinase [Candidatus Clostridium radicumherbarum]|uniref:histidine kinase n=1 Tax=Candidatus Clostridium radicumherbarum TaxID=3381662 RepID=A0ABW8TMF5_9CLOT
MSLRIRLIISYVAMIFVPIALSIVTAIIIMVIFLRSAAGIYNINLTINPYKQIIEKGVNLYNDIKTTTESNPEKFQDKSYISQLDSKLSRANSGIIIRKNNEIIYTSKILDNSPIIKNLPKFGRSNEDKVDHMELRGDSSLIRQQDFYFKDNSEGTIFLVTYIGPLAKIIERLITTIIIAIILILILTDGVLTYLVSRSVFKPIEELKHAANQIKEGNLDFEIKTNSKDEIGELCLAFEEMRGKLKESVDMQFQYENNRKELISNISHDLKTPVTAIKGYVEGIMDGVAASPEKMDKYIKTIYSKATDIDRLIDELFLFSKLDLNKLPFNFELTDITSYMQDCIEELQLDLEKKNFELIYHNYIEGSSTVLADRERIKRVITNIVENAVKYTKNENGKIEINLSKNNNDVQFQIKDNGQGIPEKDIPYIFDRFFRADLSRNTLTGGSGLGLAIAKLIIEEHGGSIWAESTEGIGTSIYFTLKQKDI